MEHPLAHHLSDEARRRKPSLAKALYAYHFIDDMQSLGGGLPDARFFPVTHASYDLPHPNDADKETSLDLWHRQFTINGETSTVDLSVAQQYQAGSSLPELQTLLENLTEVVYKPPRSANHAISVTLGNTDGVAKLFRLLLNPGDNILFEEFVFGPPVENARAMGCGLVPVKLDSEGPMPSDLDRILTHWDPEAYGPKPRVFYIVETGQNPTGSTATLPRLKDLYAIGQKHDLIFISDDPYFYLQLGPYSGTRASRDLDQICNILHASHINGNASRTRASSSLENFARTLSPTLISLDVDGRVARCDSFSKIIFPGSRLGWVTLNPLFRERCERIMEVTTQMGNGINQAFFAQLLTEPSTTVPNAGGWGMEGFIAWINRLRRSYAKKRDFILDVLEREIPSSTGLISWRAPEAGMFVWIRVHLERHPRFRHDDFALPKTNMSDLMQELFDRLVSNKCLILPARFFAVEHTLPAGFKTSSPCRLTDDCRDRSNYLRATFAPSEATIEEAIKRFGKTLHVFYDLET